MFVFVSKSGESDIHFIEAIQTELGPNVELSYEDLFRPYAVSASYQEVWSDQLRFWPRADVIIAILSGLERVYDDGFMGLPFGMGEEVYASIWAGKPVIFCATSEAGIQRATHCHKTFAEMHPCLLSYLWDASNRDAKSLARHCLTFASLPERIIPNYFEVGVPRAFGYNVCRPSQDGWLYADLSSAEVRPVLTVDYGEHLALFEPFAQQKCERRSFRLDLTITDHKTGRIDGEITLDAPGLGNMRLLWQPRAGTWADIEEYPLGVNLLHWDFDCE